MTEQTFERVTFKRPSDGVRARVVTTGFLTHEVDVWDRAGYRFTDEERDCEPRCAAALAMAMYDGFAACASRGLAAWSTLNSLSNRQGDRLASHKPARTHGQSGRRLKMLQEFHLSRVEAKCLSLHDRADLLRWMIGRRFPTLRQGFAPRRRPTLHVVGGTDTARARKKE